MVSTLVNSFFLQRPLPPAVSVLLPMPERVGKWLAVILEAVLRLPSWVVPLVTGLHERQATQLPGAPPAETPLSFSREDMAALVWPARVVARFTPLNK